MNFILKGDICYSKDKNNIICSENSYLICENGKSAGVYTDLPDKYKNFDFYDYSGKLILPGFTDLHVHAPQYAFCGIGMDMELMKWLDKQAFVEESAYSDEEYAKNAYTIFAHEIKNSVTTRACIFATGHVTGTQILMDCMEETGLVSYVGRVNMDREAPDCLIETDTDKNAGDTAKWIEYSRSKYKRTYPILTPRFIPCCSDELLSKLSVLQKKYGIPVQSHLSENPEEIRWVEENVKDAVFYGDAYDRHGLFGKNAGTIMAHCVYSDDRETELMKKNGVYIAHCPASNMNLSSGIAPIRKYIDLDMNIGLGSDIAGGHSISMLRAVTDTIQVSKMYWRYIDKNSPPITFEEAFYLATKGGGSFFGDVGSFEKGCEFDVVVIDDSVYPSSRKLSVRMRTERIIYIDSQGKSLVGKFVNGKKIQ